MSPKSKLTDAAKSLPNPGDEVVISGISGRFPESNNLTQLKENLFNKRDLITDDDRRWKSNHPDIPQRTGKVNNIEKFDSQFFGLHHEDPQVIDPIGRMLLEHAYEAIIDAGVNPRQLRGTNTGVFMSNSFSESEQELIYGTSQRCKQEHGAIGTSTGIVYCAPRRKVGSFRPSVELVGRVGGKLHSVTSLSLIELVGGSGVLGCSRSMLANRISYWLGVTGPSYNVDTACSASLFAMDHAYRAIRTGQCEAALVGASQLCLNPFMSMQFSMLGVLSSDGRSRSFDADANGYCRGEALCVIYLQKSKDAKRIYATVVHTKTNCDGFTEQGITFPSNAMQEALLQQFYEECGVSPTSLAFVEAHGTGTKVGDPIELRSLERVFCPGRTTPLRIGCVKSNLGHSEPASGACSIAKVLIAMESGSIPPNLHYNRPRDGIEALVDGRMEVITELTPWDGGYVGVNSFGFGGSNAHVLLKSNPKEKINNGAPNDDLPRLVVVSGRTQEAVETLLDDLESRPVDVEYVSLFHNIHADEIPGHWYRGYTILPPRGSIENSVRNAQHYSHPRVKRPVWFVFSGLGTPRAEIGKAFLKIPVFLRTIQKCNAALKPHGVDIIDILTTEDSEIFTNVSNWFVAIAAVQVGLLDLLASIGIVPNNVVGNSMGEFGCAYADGCFSAEQIVLSAYSQSLRTMKIKTLPRPLDRVLRTPYSSDTETTYQIGSRRSPIDCSSDTTTDSDTKLQAVSDAFMDENLCDCHSTGAVNQNSLPHLQEVIPDPHLRSKKLIREAPCNKCETISAGFFSPEYHKNNSRISEIFDKMFHVIPKNTIVVEIASHGYLQTILRRSSNGKVTSIALANSGFEDPMKLLLQAIGTVYQLGLHPQLTNLYPDVQYPVSRGTPMIAPLVRWEHTKDWYVQRHTTQKKIDSGERVVNITLSDEAFEWMAGHVIDGRNLVPATGYLALVWETVALLRGKLLDEVSVVFKDVRFHRATAIPKQEGVKLMIFVQRGSGRFEVTEGNTSIVTGFIRATSKPAQECITAHTLPDSDETLDLTSRDIYKELRLRGYNYTGLFRGLERASLEGTTGSIAWKNNWVAFMDNMLQLEILGMDTRGLFVPTGIQKLVVNTEVHLKQLRMMPDDNKAFAVEVLKHSGTIVSGGVAIRGLKASAIARKKPAGDPVLEDFKFTTHRDRAPVDLRVATRIAMQIVLENHSDVKIKTIELIDHSIDLLPENLTSPIIHGLLGDLPLVQANVIIISPIDTISADALPSAIKISEPDQLTAETDALLVIGHGLLANEDVNTLKQIQRATKDAGFLLAREPLNADAHIFSTIQSENLDVVLEKRTVRELVLLLRKRPKLSGMVTVIQINNYEFAWLSTLQAALKAESENSSRERDRILLVSEGDFESGLMGLVNCLRKEPGGRAIQGLLIQDPQAPKFSLANPLYSRQLDLGLALNILRPREAWGSYRFFAIDSLPLRPVHHFRINQLTRGDLSSLKWVEGPIQPNTHNQHRNLIEVHYSSINFRDVMISSGKLAVEVYAKTRKSQENVIGIEFSGRDVNGRAVMGMILGGAFSNLCVCDSELLWPVPDNWTLEDAATVPVVYATAYYALMINGKMKKGDKVLIHAGSGGVGQAAITLALHEGCEIFTTVGTPQKRQFIRDHFPQIDDDHIGNSRDTSFEQLIFRKTEGKGVDIVLNSLAEEKLQASIRCLRTGGRFLEIGKFDLAANNSVGMAVFLKGISFHGVYLDNLFTTPSEKKMKLVAMVTDGLKSGAVRPLVRTTFAMDQVEMAFRYMAAGKHIGKVVVRIRNETEERQVPRGLPRYHCFEDSSYLILGGLGGFGLELADWLVLRGATKLILTSRRGITTGYQRYRINIWKSYGVEIIVIVGRDASTYEGCEEILKTAAAIGPVDAIFNLAVVLEDSLCENQTVESFEKSFRVKAWATKQLDKLSRKLCPRLRQFVVFSSVSCGRGNAGQTNYGMSNSVMERICERRAADNLPALAIQWGAVGDVGLVAEMQEDEKEVVIGGTLQQKISSCLRELDGFLLQNSPVVSSMVVAEKTAGTGGATNVGDAVINIMGLKSLKTVSLHTSLAELGMDSMMAVEIKQTLEREFEVFLTSEDIRGLNFYELEKISQKQVGGEDSCETKDTNETDNLSGVKLLIRTLGIDRINKDICVPLVTEAERERKEVFILPGIEGTHIVFESLAKKLKSPTTCLQLPTSHIGSTSIDDIADHLIPHIRARNRGRKDFVIAGYSFGSLIAIELVRRLELVGFSGRLVLLDGSPDYLKLLIHQNLNVNTDDEMQSNLLLGIMTILAPSVSKKLAWDLQNCNTWEEKLATFTKNLPDDRNLNLTGEDQEAVCSSLYQRFKAIQTYDPSVLSPLETPITLIRPKIQTVRSISGDYGLQSLTRGKVEVCYATGNHATMLHDDLCAAAIDGELVGDVFSRR